MISEVKYVVSQFWNVSEFRLNSGGEPAPGLVLSRDGRIIYLSFLRIY